MFEHLGGYKKGGFLVGLFSWKSPSRYLNGYLPICHLSVVSAGDCFEI